MRWRRSRPRPKSGLFVASAGLAIALLSGWPWAQQPNRPWRAVDAGQVGVERIQVLVCGLGVSAVGLVVCTSASRRLLLVFSAIGGFAVLGVAGRAIDSVSEIMAIDSRVVGEVGWALYGIEWAGLVAVVASIIGLRTAQLGPVVNGFITGFRPTEPSDHAGRAGPTQLGVAARWFAMALMFMVGSALLFVSVGGLREAHLYRQRTGEGLKFAWVGIGLVLAHCLLGTVAYVATRLRTLTTEMTAQRTALGVAVLIVSGLATSDVLFVWVAAHGDRCIRGCA